MQHIETIAEVNQNGFITIAVPDYIRAGKHHVILVIDEAVENNDSIKKTYRKPPKELAGKIKILGDIISPV